MKPNITPEVIEALRTLREHARYNAGTRPAFNILDNAGIFSAIDEATGYDVDPVQVGSDEWHAAMGAALAETPLYAHRKQVSRDQAPLLKGGSTRRADARNDVIGRECPADDCTGRYAVNQDGSLRAHSNDMCEPCSQERPSTAPVSPYGTVQCAHCHGDYKPKRDGTLRKHSCWRYDQGLKTIVYGDLDVHGRGATVADNVRRAINLKF